MRTLARPVGLGLAARGDIEDVVGWARRARDAGLDSIWVHDSYFERDAVSFCSAVASAIGGDGDRSLVEGEAGFRVALGAVNPFTRHPVVLAMTGSALDEMLPGRIVMGLGTGLAAAAQADGHPVRPGVRRRAASRRRWTRSARCGRASGCRPRRRACRRSSRCSRRPTGSRSCIAAYRKEFVALAGQKADGYLARPAESIPSLTGILERLREAADRGRPGPGRDRDGRATCSRSSTRPAARRSTGPSASRSSST